MKTKSILCVPLIALCLSCSVEDSGNERLVSDRKPPVDTAADSQEPLPGLEGKCSDTGTLLEEPSVSEPDSTAPVITAMRASKDVYSPGEHLSIIMKVSEEVSGISHMFVRELVNENDETAAGSTNSPDFFTLPDGLLCSQSTVLSKYAKDGVYKVLDIDLYDNAGNGTEYIANLNTGFYEGTNIKIIQIEYRRN
jgi:hypothetical protein